jgi:hypothetical protein
MKTKILIFIVSFFVLTACKPDMFYLNENKFDKEAITGFKVCPLDSVEVLAGNAFIMYSGSLVDMCCNEIPITQFRADFTANIVRGTGLRFSFRTIIDSYETHPNISFDYTLDGCNVYENNKLLVRVDSIKAVLNQPTRILIENYGKLYNIVVDCDTVFYGSTNLPATQHMILKTLENSDIRLSGIDFEYLNKDIKKMYGFEPEEVLLKSENEKEY